MNSSSIKNSKLDGWESGSNQYVGIADGPHPKVIKTMNNLPRNTENNVSEETREIKQNDKFVVNLLLEDKIVYKKQKDNPTRRFHPHDLDNQEADLFIRKRENTVENQINLNSIRRKQLQDQVSKDCSIDEIDKSMKTYENGSKITDEKDSINSSLSPLNPVRSRDLMSQMVEAKRKRKHRFRKIEVKKMPQRAPDSRRPSIEISSQNLTPLLKQNNSRNFKSFTDEPKPSVDTENVEIPSIKEFHVPISVRNPSKRRKDKYDDNISKSFRINSVKSKQDKSFTVDKSFVANVVRVKPADSKELEFIFNKGENAKTDNQIFEQSSDEKNNTAKGISPFKLSKKTRRVKTDEEKNGNSGKHNSILRTKKPKTPINLKQGMSVGMEDNTQSQNYFIDLKSFLLQKKSNAFSRRVDQGISKQRSYSIKNKDVFVLIPPKETNEVSKSVDIKKHILQNPISNLQKDSPVLGANKKKRLNIVGGRNGTQLLTHAPKLNLFDSCKKRFLFSQKIFDAQNCLTFFKDSFTYYITPDHKITVEKQPKINQVALQNLDKDKPLLLLDLDETLVHTEFTEGSSINDGHEASVKVRPYTSHFLQEINKYWNVCVFTAGHRDYAKDIVKIVDPAGNLISNILNRDHCTEVHLSVNDKKLEKEYIKELRIILNFEISRIVIIDNKLISFRKDINAGIPILPFYGDKRDIELKMIVPFLIDLSSSQNIHGDIYNRYQLDELFGSSQQQQSICHLNNTKFQPIVTCVLFRVSSM